MIYRIFLIFVLAFYSLNAQEYTHLETYKPNLELNPANLTFDLAYDGNGNIYFAGLETGNYLYGSSYFGDYAIRKYNSSLEFQKKFVIGGNSIINIVECDYEGNIYTSGYFRDSLIYEDFKIKAHNTHIHEAFIFKINPDGELLNYKIIHDPETQPLISAMVLNHKKLYITVTDLPVETQIMVLDGELNLERSFIESGTWASSMAVDDFGFIYTAGASGAISVNFNGTSVPSPFPYKQYAARYSPEGKMVWYKFIQDVTFTKPKIECSPDGAAFFTGSLISDASINEEFNATGPGKFGGDFYLMKISSDGDIEWFMETENKEGDISYASGGRGDNLHYSEGFIYMSGHLRGKIDWGNNIITDSKEGQAMIIFKIDSKGGIHWIKQAEIDHHHYVDAVDSDNSGALYLSGYTLSAAKFDEHNLDDFPAAYLAKLKDMPSSVAGTDAGSISFYPNPATDQIRINDNQILSTIIVDVNGREILKSQSQVIRTGNLAKGMYFVIFTYGNGSIKREKLIIR